MSKPAGSGKGKGPRPAALGNMVPTAMSDVHYAHNSIVVLSETVEFIPVSSAIEWPFLRSKALLVV